MTTERSKATEPFSFKTPFDHDLTEVGTIPPEMIIQRIKLEAPVRVMEGETLSITLLDDRTVRVAITNHEMDVTVSKLMNAEVSP